MGRAAGFPDSVYKGHILFSQLCGASWAAHFLSTLEKHTGGFHKRLPHHPHSDVPPPTLQRDPGLTLLHHLSPFPPEVS